jgi:hypothetical protein
MSDTSRVRLSCSGAGRDRQSQLVALVTGIAIRIFNGWRDHPNLRIRLPIILDRSKFGQEPINAENDDE